MPVWIVENATQGNRAYCTMNEGLGKVLRYGAYSGEVIEKLRWMRDTLYPALHRALERSGPIDLKNIIAQALHMGDEARPFVPHQLCRHASAARWVSAPDSASAR